MESDHESYSPQTYIDDMHLTSACAPVTTSVLKYNVQKDFKRDDTVGDVRQIVFMRRRYTRN